jgi:phage tail P2-like protein
MDDPLLPISSSKLEHAISLSAAKIEKIPILNQHLWDPWQCPESFLPWLAHGLSVDSWNNDWPEQVKRQVIADSVPMHRIKGTISSIKSAIEALNITAQVEEEWQTQGLSHSAKIVAENDKNRNVDNTPKLTAQLQHQLWRAIVTTKPLRTKMHINITNSQSSSVYAGASLSNALLQRVDLSQQTHFDFSANTLHVCSTTHATSVQRNMVKAGPNQLLIANLHSVAAQSLILFNHSTMVCR